MEEPIAPTPPPEGNPVPQLAPSVPTPTNLPIPPAAKVVLEGTKTEREMLLEKQLRDRETRVAELEDENRTLKTIPVPAQSPAPEKKSWLSGCTFFDPE